MKNSIRKKIPTHGKNKMSVYETKFSVRKKIESPLKEMRLMKFKKVDNFGRETKNFKWPKRVSHFLFSL